jgi:ABC-type transporter Mla subunit MlaD
MALQDLTPQLRTRLSRMERAVGWFVALAIGLLLFGFAYYLYSTAQRKGWFKTKAPYFTFTDRATGLKVGDPVRLMGFDVGQITRIDAQPADDFRYNVYLEFEIQSPYYGYLWTEGSRAKVTTADFLGKRQLEVTKGIGGYPTYVFNPLRTVTPAQARLLPNLSQWAFGQEIHHSDSIDLVARPLEPLSEAKLDELQRMGVASFTVLDRRETRKLMTGMWHDKESRYVPYVRGTSYWLLSDESPAVTERLERLVAQVEKALPGVLALTNQLGAVLSNTASLTAHLDEIAQSARPAVSNLAVLTAELDRPGALGEWLLPTHLNRQLGFTLDQASNTLGQAGTTLASANTNLSVLAANLNRSLDNLAEITRSLNQQVQGSTNMLPAISEAVTHADELIQGLKRHWLLRSAFRTPATNAPPAQPPLRSPKDPHR